MESRVECNWAARDHKDLHLAESDHAVLAATASDRVARESAGNVRGKDPLDWATEDVQHVAACSAARAVHSVNLAMQAKVAFVPATCVDAAEDDRVGDRETTTVSRASTEWVVQ